VDDTDYGALHGVQVFRAPDDFLDTLTASMLSEQVVPTQALTHQISTSLFFRSIPPSKLDGKGIVGVILVSLTLGAHPVGWQKLPRAHEPLP
jgi:hypothetical protein